MTMISIPQQTGHKYHGQMPAGSNARTETDETMTDITNHIIYPTNVASKVNITQNDNTQHVT